MSLDADLIVDRRRMRRKLTFWRVLAIRGDHSGDRRRGRGARQSRRVCRSGAYIARVTIKGLIRDDEERVQQLEQAGAQSTTAAP